MTERTQRPLTRNEVRRMKLRRRMSFDPDATAMFELRSDGVPVEIAGGKTDEIPAYGVGAASPRFVVLSVWAMVLALTLYGAKDLRALVQYDESLAGYSVLLKVVEGIHSLASTLGATDAKDALDDVFLPIKTKVPDESELVAAMDVTQGNPAEGSAAAPARVLLVGASSIEFYMGTELERRLELYDGVTVHRFGKLGTGLARPDNFDWPKQLTKLLANYRPHLVIAQFGGNDSQPLEADGGMVQPGTPEWDADYTQRVKRVAAQVQASGAKMIMLGMPITRHRKHSDRLRQVNVVTRAAAEAAGATYIPTWDIAADERAEPRTQMTHDGKTGPMYLPDGVHLGRVGAAYVAQRIAWRLERLLVMTPSDRALAAVKPLDVDSKATGRSAHYLAFVPQGLKPDTKLPVLYLLHGADASSEAFSENAHDLLQRLAAKYQLVLVAPDADPHGWYLDSGEIPKSNSETFIIEELLPDVERRLPVSTRRGVAGISMGGNGAVMLSLKHPKTFVAASSMSGAVDLSQATDRPALIERLGPFEQNKDAWLGNSALQLVRKNGPAARALPVLLTVGAEDKWVPANRALAAALREAGAVHELREVPGGHTWAVWVAALPAHVEWHSLKLGEGSAAR